MKSAIIRNSVLLLVIIGLYWFINRAPSPLVDSHHLTSLQAEHVTTIHIQRHDRDDIKLSKQDDDWFIDQPIQANANITRTKLILNLLSSVSHSQLTITPNLTLQQFSLEPAKVKLRLNDQLFEFGNIEPISKHRYIRHNNILHLVNDTVMPLLNANANSFIDNRLFSANQHITQLSLPEIVDGDSHTQAVTISLEDGHWQSSNSVLSTDSLTAVITSWQHAYAMQVMPFNNANAFAQTVTVEFADKTSSNLLLQLTSHHIALIDVSKKLQYQFPRAKLQQFLPIQDPSD